MDTTYRRVNPSSRMAWMEWGLVATLGELLGPRRPVWEYGTAWPTSDAQRPSSVPLVGCAHHSAHTAISLLSFHYFNYVISNKYTNSYASLKRVTPVGTRPNCFRSWSTTRALRGVCTPTTSRAVVTCNNAVTWCNMILVHSSEHRGYLYTHTATLYYALFLSVS